MCAQHKRAIGRRPVVIDRGLHIIGVGAVLLIANGDLVRFS